MRKALKIRSVSSYTVTMMICTEGSICFNCARQSIPDMLGN